MSDERQFFFERRSGQERRSGVDSRPLEEQRLTGESRSGIDRRLVNDRTIAELGVHRREGARLLMEGNREAGANTLARHPEGAQTIEQKLNLILQAMTAFSLSLAEIERRVRSIQQNTANRRL
jgi:hypothetical protein